LHYPDVIQNLTFDKDKLESQLEDLRTEKAQALKIIEEAKKVQGQQMDPQPTPKRNSSQYTPAPEHNVRKSSPSKPDSEYEYKLSEKPNTKGGDSRSHKAAGDKSEPEIRGDSPFMFTPTTPPVAKKLTPLIDEQGFEKPYRERPEGRESVHSNEGEDQSHYLILKRKFDEIHVFVTRIAGLLSKSIQECRRRHASSHLKDTYRLASSERAENLRLWLTNSPSKSQVDKDSRRFYFKFKKRFDSGMSRNVVIDLLRNFTDFVTEKCQLLLDEYNLFYSLLADTLGAIRNSPALQRQFDDLFVEIGGDDAYEKLISGNDFETIFRNVLSSSLVKLAQLMTDLLDSRLAEIRLRKVGVENFMNKNLVVKKTPGRGPIMPEQPPVFQNYQDHLYDSL
jgi:hypothetical protein